MTRVLLTLAFVAAWALFVFLIFRAWRRRGERQRELVGTLPARPAELGAPVLAPATGLYVGSTLAPSWINRVAVGDVGARAAATVSAYEAGVLIERQGASDLWIPRAALVGVRTDSRLAGKVMTPGGLLVLRWRTPAGAEVDSGFRGDDKIVYSQWLGFDSGKNGV